MVGLIQKLLLDLVEKTAGAGAVDEVKKRAGVPLDQRFRLDTVYADDEWQRILAATCEVLGITQDLAEVAFADYFGRDAVARWPTWFKMSRTARQLLERQPVIHNTFATGVQNPHERNGINDKFSVEKLDDGIVTHYRSGNRLCGLYKALARWVLDYYKEEAAVSEARCLKNGDAECEIHIRWPAVAVGR